LRFNASLGLRSGALVAVPNPQPLDSTVVERAVATALRESRERGIIGRAATPFLLDRLNQLTCAYHSSNV
jgi:pseudouridine-5'-phosphate glycosidase